MDIQRMLLVVIFGMSAFFLWNEWQKVANPHLQPAAVSTTPAAPSGSAPAAPAATSNAPVPSAVPSTPATSTTPSASSAGVPAVAPAAAAPAAGERITLESDLLRIVVNTTGGVIEEADLKTQKGTLDKSKPYQLLQNNPPNRLAVVQAGLLGEGMPYHGTVYSAEPGPRTTDGADAVQLRLTAPITQGPATGGKVTQIVTLKKGSYVVDIAFEITNAGQTPLATTAYYHLLRDNKMPAGESSMVPTYTGPVVYDEADKFTKLSWSDIEKKKSKYVADPANPKPPQKADNGWVAMVEHYFVAAILPPDKVEREIYAGQVDSNFRIGVKITPPAIAPGATGRVDVPVYLGPQEQETLDKTAKGLDRVVDYGIFHIIAEPLFMLLSWLYKIVGNWGWAIIVLTILIKGVFYPLNAASARSMAKLKMVAPKMKQLQEQYANDKQQLQVKMMEMYRTEKINPLGGCLPILVQIPVFIALYWVLLGAVELRHAPWWGWIQDLSAPDPWYILPVLYALTAWVQVKLQPPAPGMDPMQQKIMQMMPIMFSVMFIFFPSGLVLYWFVQNILTIIQQWHVNRMLAAEAKVKAAAAATRR